MANVCCFNEVSDRETRGIRHTASHALLLAKKGAATVSCGRSQQRSRAEQLYLYCDLMDPQLLLSVAEGS